MNRRLLLLCSLFSLFWVAADAQTYCTPAYTSACSFLDDINTFTLTGANSTSFNQPNTGCTASGFANYTSLTAVDLIAGQTYNGTINSEYSSNEYVRIWIDFNSDGTFASTEEVGTVSNIGTTLVPYTISIPISATSGIRRMRVRMGYGSSPASSIDPCTSIYYGETHDYNVNVIAVAPCTGAPVIGTASATPNPVCPNVSFTLSLSGQPASSGLVYQWQSGTSASGPWTNITGANGATYTVAAGISVTSYYHLLVTCGTVTSTSNAVTVAVNPPSACYCTPVYTYACQYQDDIHTVTLTGANSTSINQPNTGCTSGGYANYTALTPVQLVAGQTYNGTMNSEYSGSEYVRIWIDLNDNGLFDNTEQVGTLTSIGTTLQAYTITLPASAPSGTHRMRMRMAYFVSPASSIDPCLSYAYGETHDYNVVVLGPPVVTSNSPVCNGGTIVLTATSPFPSPTFTFSGPGITTTSNTTGILNIPNTTAASAGNYNVTVTSGTFTSGATTVAVVISAPTATTLGTITAPTACGGNNGSIQVSGLTAAGVYVVNYTKNSVAQAPLTLTASATGVVTIPNLTSATYSNIIFTSSAGCTTAPLTQVTVPSPSAPPTPSGNYNPPLCKGSNLVLTVSNPNSAGSYYWSGPTGFNDSGLTVGRTNLQLQDSGNYLLTVVIANCVSQPGTVHVSITPPPAPPVTAPVSYCQNSVAVPLTAVGQGLKWYDSLLSTNPYTSAPTPSTVVPGTRKYYVAQTINTCVGFKDSVAVTIKPTPATPVAATTVSYCQYDQATALTATGLLIKWYTAPTGGSALATAPVPGTFVPGTLTYYVTQTVLGCESNRLPITVIIKPKPAPPTVVTPIRYCQYDQAPALTANGTNLKWYESANGGSGSPVAPVPITYYEDTTTWWVTQTVNGCESDRSKIDVIINVKANGIILASRPFVCQYDTTTFWYYGNARPSFDLDWKVPAKYAEIVDTLPANGIAKWGIRVRFDSAGSIPVRLQVNNNGCLSDEVIYSMQVRPVPVVRIATKKDVCLNEESIVSLDKTSQSVDYYQWDFGTGNVVVYGSQEGPYGIKWNTPGYNYISVIAGTDECPAKPVYDTVHVHLAPAANIGFMSKTGNICTGDTVIFNASTKQVYGDTADAGVGPYVYRWLPKIDFREADSLSDVATGIIVSTAPVKLQVLDRYGCYESYTADLYAAPCCKLTVPTAFTPNGDARNDVFNLLTRGHQKIASFRILNRWGKVVFETADQHVGWDGTTGGAAQDVGTYYYYVKYQCDDNSIYELKGELTLIR